MTGRPPTSARPMSTPPVSAEQRHYLAVLSQLHTAGFPAERPFDPQPPLTHDDREARNSPEDPQRPGIASVARSCLPAPRLSDAASILLPGGRNRPARRPRELVERSRVDARHDAAFVAAETSQLLRLQHVDNQGPYVRDVARSCLAECLKAGIREDRVGEAPVCRVGLAAHQTPILETLDHTRQARER